MSCAYAYDIHDENVETTEPSGTSYYGGKIEDAANNGNVFSNTLTVNRYWEKGGVLYGGYNYGIGDATKNTVIANFYLNRGSSAVIYGGYARNGNATGNTVVLRRRAEHEWNKDYILYGGYSSAAGKDVKTGNTLRVESTENRVTYLYNFEKMVFQIPLNLSDNTYFLSVQNDTHQTFDWANIEAPGGEAWARKYMADRPGQLVRGLRLYTGPALTMTGTPWHEVKGDYEFGVGGNGSNIYYLASRFQNADITIKGREDGVYWGGWAYFGSTVQNNRLTFEKGRVREGKSANAIAGSGMEGSNVTHNTLVLKDLDVNGSFSGTGGSAVGSGNATHNTVVLDRVTWWEYGNKGTIRLYGGTSNTGDKVTGNTLRVVSADNLVTEIYNFEKMEFDLEAYANQYGGNPNRTMLKVRTGTSQTFKWSNITVKGLAAYSQYLMDHPNAGYGARNTMRLYTGGTLTIEDHAERFLGNYGDFEYGLSSRSGTTPQTRQLGTIDLDMNRFQNATRAAYSSNGRIGGYSYFDNTTNHNTVDEAISQGTTLDWVYGGYTDGLKGGSDYNKVTLYSYYSSYVKKVYGGYTIGLTASDADKAVNPAAKADAKYNIVTIRGAVHTDEVYGGGIFKNYRTNTASDGDASHNTVNLLNTDGKKVYGGYTEGSGNATHNTVTLGSLDSSEPYGGGSDAVLYGGGGTGSGDYVTGNKLITHEGWAHSLYNFEKIEFRPNQRCFEGSTALNVKNGTNQQFEWSNVTVDPTRLSAWVTYAMAKNINNPSMQLYRGGTLTLHHYDRRFLGNTGDFEFGQSAETTATGTVNTDKINLHGYRFQNVTTPTVDGTEVCGGYSYYGNTTNHNKFVFTARYGYANIRGGYTNAQKGGSDENELGFGTNEGGRATNLYGGYTVGTAASDVDKAKDPAAKADAKKNIVRMYSGIVTGNVYGGYIAENPTTHTTSDGDARENTVIFESGSIGGDIYGGYTEGTGKTTGNTVRLHVGEVTGTVSGGNKADTTGNTLEIANQATAGKIKNFSWVRFTLNPWLISNPKPMLTLKTGVADFDWGKFDAEGNAPEGEITLLRNENGINFGSTYTGTKITLNTATNERVIYTDTKTGVGVKNILHAAYQFKDAAKDVPTAKPGPMGDIWAGRSIIGNTTRENTLNIEDETTQSYRDAYGGWTAGTGTTHADQNDSRNNTVNVKKGYISKVYGGFTEASTGSATDNKVNLSGGRVGTVYGGYLVDAAASGNAKGNIVTITGGYMGNVYGGFVNSSGTGKATHNIVNIGDGTHKLSYAELTGTLYGGNKDADITGNTLNVKTNATAFNIANFDQVNFDLNESRDKNRAMLTVRAVTTTVNWGKLDATGEDPDINEEVTLLHNENGLNFGTSYTSAKMKAVTETHERVIYTDTKTGTGAKSILYGHFQFKDAERTVGADEKSQDIWAGRSLVGNTTRENTLNVNFSGLHKFYRDAYGGWTTGTGTPKAEQNDSQKNTVNLKGGRITRNLYGGYVEAAGGKAEENKVNISGGSVEGTVYGGYVAHDAATGNATKNTVTISGGSLKDVYGGFVNPLGTGKTTDNAVTIERGASISGVLYGGNRTDDTGNTLTVNYYVTVKNIKNFEKLVFNIPDQVYKNIALLNLVGGDDTNNLDWSKVEVRAGASLGADIKSYEPLGMTLMESRHNKIDFHRNAVDTYTALGAKGRTEGDLEYVIDTNSHTAIANRVTLEGYRFRNHTDATYTAADGSHASAWAGRTAIGNKVENNTLTVDGNTLGQSAHGGFVENRTYQGGHLVTTGDATKNTLVVKGGAHISQAYGAEVRTKDGSATDNHVAIAKGYIGNAYGGALVAGSATGKAEKNTVTLVDGNVSGNVYGSYASGGTSTVTKNTVTVSGGSVNGTIYGGFLASSTAPRDVAENTVTLTGGTVKDVYGGYTGNHAVGKTNKNIVNLGDGTNPLASGSKIEGVLYGGNSTAANGNEGNTLNIKTNATAKNIVNFEKVNFDLNASLDKRNPMLNLNGGTATAFDWGKFTVTGERPAPDEDITLLKNTYGINFGATYTGTILKGITHTHEYVVYTDTGSDVGAKEIHYGTYQFKDAEKSFAAARPNPDLWAGRSVAGNSTRDNTLTITGGNHRDAYGGWTVGTGTTEADQDDSRKNTVSVTGGTLTGNLYGGYTNKAGGNATENQVTIAGGEIQGTLYGGHLADAAATGNATGNTVTITGGKMKDVYGGYTANAAAGKTTGNTVTLGDGTNALATGTKIDGTLYGGSRTGVGQDEDNLLHVKANAEAKNIKNFAKLKFDLNDSVDKNRVMLRLTGGAATTELDWGQVDVDLTKATGKSTKSYEAYEQKILENQSDLNFTKNGVDTYVKYGIREDTKGDFEYVIDTDTHSALAKRVSIFGYQFQNNQTATYKATDNSHPEAWGGRSVVGHTVKDNALTVSGGTLTKAAYGGLVENHKIDPVTHQPVATGSAEKNTLTIEGGTVKDAYGAEVRTKEGSASKNTVNLNGGTITGSVYGGALTAAGATGNANENTVNLTANAGGDVYGGFTNGTGKTRDNTVTLGDGQTALSLTFGGTIHGGNSTAADGNTDNTLHVKANATAKNIKNFEKLVFDLNDTINTANPMLHLNGGAATTELDWTKLEADMSRLNGDNIKSYEPLGQVLMKNVNGIDFTKGGNNTYNGAKERVTEKFEFVLDTDTHTVHGTEVGIKGYQFKDHTNATYAASDGAHTNAWSGRTAIGNNVENNTLTVSGTTGTLTTAHGGWAENTRGNSGNAVKNRLVLTGGTVTDGYGAEVKTKDGSVAENHVELKGGTATNVYGGALTAAGATGNAKKNTVTIDGGTVNGGIYGGAITDAAATGDAAENEITVKTNVAGSLYGGYTAGAGRASGNTVTLARGNVGGDVTGGHSNGGETRNNTINLGDGTAPATISVTGTIYGGNKTGAGEDAGNTLNVKANATAKDIKNFAGMKFTINQHINPAAAMLTLTEATGTKELDWRTLEVDTQSALGVPTKSYEAYTQKLMENTHGLAFEKNSVDTYADIGLREIKNDGKFEYTLDTDTHSANAKRVDLVGYQYKDNRTATYRASDGSHQEAWGGRTVLGNTVENNQLTVDGGQLTKGAYGGFVENHKRVHGTPLTTGDAVNNTVLVKGAAQTAEAFGAKVEAKDGSATENTATIEGGTVGAVSGAALTAAGATGNAANNHVTIAGGTINGRVSGGSLLDGGATGSATENTVDITGGTLNGDVYGGFTNGSGKTTKNTVTLGDGTHALAANFAGTIYGGSDHNDVTGNTLNVKANAQAKNIKNFENLKFSLNNTVNRANPMLRLTENTGTHGLDWGKITVDPNHLDGVGTKSYEAIGYTLMENAHGLDFTKGAENTYAKKGAWGKTDGNFEYVLDANADENGENATKVTFTGYQFKDNTAATYKATDGNHTEAWGGRSVIGNYVQNNTLTVDGGTLTQGAYGGMVENNERNADGTKKTTGDAVKNNLVLKTGANTLDAAGAIVKTKDGKAEENTVTMEGGTVNGSLAGGTLAAEDAKGNATKNHVTLKGGSVTGDVYGGYLEKATAKGHATGNTVTIEGGTMNDVYGGYTAGNGKTTGNIVNLGSGNAALASGTTLGILHGGNSTAAGGNEGNTLNVKANAQAKNIKNFEHVKFHLNNTMAQGSTLLKLTGGAATQGLDWGKITVDPHRLNGVGTKSYEAIGYTLMENANGLDFTKGAENTYAKKGAWGKTDGNFEYVLDANADENGENATKVTFTGYQFKDNTAATYKAIDGNHTEAWGGRSVIGNHVQNNTLTVDGGTLTKGAYGGMVENNERNADGTKKTTGDAVKNNLILKTGANTLDAAGAIVKTKDGKAEENTVTMEGGTVTGSLFGGSITAKNAAGSATKNRVTLKGGAVTGDVYGGHLKENTATGSVAENTVTIEGGTMGDVYGGYTAGAGKTTGNIVNIGDGTKALASGTAMGVLHGGNSTAAGGNEGNTLNVKANAQAKNIKNFDNLKFYIGSHVNKNNPMLKLTDGAETKELDWTKLTVDTPPLTGVSSKSYEAYTQTLLQNNAGLNFNRNGNDTYAGVGPKEIPNGGDFEFSLKTDTNSAIAKRVDITGYQFQNNTTAKYDAVDAGHGPHSMAWGGRTAVGNTVTNNTLTVTSGSATLNVYGGLTEQGGTSSKKGDAVKNTLLLKAGANTANAFGAEVRTKEGKAEENTVTMEGGTVNGKLAGGTLAAENAQGNATKNRVTIKDGTVTGDLYGGYLEKATATGSAKDNTVTIEGGTMADVYGGYTNGTGETTGNTVNLGNGTDALKSGTTMGILHGGNKGDAGNTLNVKANAQAKNIKNFQNLNFNLNGSIMPVGSTILKLTDGVKTKDLDWDKLKVDPMAFTGAGTKSYEALGYTLMENAAGLEFKKGGNDTYAPLGARGETNGNLEYVIDTDTHNADAKKVTLSGYQFQNNTQAKYDAADAAHGPHREAWGGRTAIGNTVTNNTLTVSSGNAALNVYGGLVERWTNTRKKGDATKNTLVLKAGSTTANAFGAEVRTKDGSAAENTVLMEGGTVTNNLYGAALTDANATGNATNNTVTLKGGTINGHVYGGFTRGTGKTTGNTVNLGDGSGPITATVGGTIYGGSGADTTGNTLNVNDKGVTAGSVKGFSSIRFKLGSSVGNGDTVLKLTEDTTIDYSSIVRPEVDNWLGDQMERTAHLIGMQGGKTLTLNGYVSGTGIKRGGDVEYALKTDNDLMTTTGSLDLSAYKWQNANVMISRALANVFGGKALYAPNGETQNNKLTLNNGADVTTAIGGDTQTENGFSKKNLLTINEGANVHDKAIGGKAKKGDVIENTAKMQGGAVKTLIGGESADGKAQGNIADLNKGTVTDAFGGKAGTTAEKNRLILNGSAKAATLTGGQGKAANENIIEITGGTVTNAITGGEATAGDAMKNTVTVTGGTVNANLFGGKATGKANENTVTYKANGNGDLTVGHSSNGDAEKNVLQMTGKLTGNVVGGNAVKGSASGNMLNLQGAHITGNVTGGTGAATNNNVIALRNTEISGTVTGGTNGTGTGNTLNVHWGVSKIGDFKGIQNLHFYLENGVNSSTPPLLQVGTGKDIRNLKVGVGVSGAAPALQVNDVISLMKVNGTLTMNDPMQNHVEGMQGVSILYGFDLKKRNNDELVAMVTRGAINDKTKSFVETRNGGSSFINQGSDLLADLDLSGGEDKDKGKYRLWAILNHGNMRQETGSHVNTHGWNLAVGWAREDNVTVGKRLFSPFVEYGRGSYSSLLDDDTYGSGKLSYLGVGVIGRIERNDGGYIEGAIHGGKMRSDYTGSILPGTISTYDSSNPYYAAHLTVGKKMTLKTGDTITPYVKYLWSHQNGMKAMLNTGEEYDFSSVDSHRLRVGARYRHHRDEDRTLYAGLAFEYELGGGARATYQGFDTPSTSMRGASAMLEFGYRFTPKKGRLSYDLRLTGWQGKRRGFMGTAQVTWAF